MLTYMMISWRNIWRNKRRSLVVISSIALGIFAMIFSMAFMNGMNVQAVENTISTSLGHIAVHKEGFQDNMKLELNFRADDVMLKKIEENPHVTGVAPHVKIQGMVRSSEAARGVLIVGIEPEKEKKISRIEYYTIKEEGSRFLSSPNDDSILISKSMAEKLDLLVGDRLVVMIQDSENRITGVGLKIEGLFETPVSSFDKNVVFMGIDKLQEVTGIGENISELTVILDNKKRVDRIKQEFISSINNNNLEILSWKDMAPNLVSAIKLFDNMMYIFFSIIFITVIFSVANTLIMAIMERFHEIGVMKSIGTRPRLIFFMVIFEAVNLGIVGLLGGMVAAIIVVLILSVTGIDLSFYMESMRLWGTGSIIYPVMKTLDVVVATFIVFFTVIVAALYPGIKAARIKPLEALHYV
jgi:ABC-type lipoprotein release transport system permease subunit